MKLSNIKSEQEKLVEFYDEINFLYNSIYPGYHKHNEKLAQSIIDIIDYDNVEVYVDLGCGTSNLLLELATKRPNVKFYGIDISPKTIDFCNLKLKLPNIEYINKEWQEGLKEIKEKENRLIDVISCFGNTLCHYPLIKQCSFLNSILDVLSIQGMFLFDAYKGWNDRLYSNDFYYFEPKGLSKDEKGLIVNSDFFSRYSKEIAIRNIFITTYKGFNMPPDCSKHFVTWQFPLHQELLKDKIPLADGLGLFDYYIKQKK